MPSTVIQHLSYDEETGTLTIAFVSGLIYNYKEVPEDEYFALKTAFSKGIYFNKHIKDKYEFERVDTK